MFIQVLIVSRLCRLLGNILTLNNLKQDLNKVAGEASKIYINRSFRGLLQETIPPLGWKYQ